ncbi:hypothetical protein JDW15_04400 [Aerococcaceae bacterium zg-ZJ1578]|uniref:hypothetical protein n=1 Tax=Aerococcaceae bacterium zg-252 TaxID=2796928 RepID=UPI001A2BDB85|nr:hypothetical protein [Aerococcaceae bacterium zg-1578]
MEYEVIEVNEVKEAINSFFKELAKGFELVKNGVQTPEEFVADLTQTYLDILDMREDVIGRYSDEEMEELESMWYQLNEDLDGLADILAEQFGYLTK